MFRRLVAAAILAATAAVLLVAAWPQLLGLQTAPGVAQVVSLRGLAALGALVIGLVVLVFAILIRRLRVLGMGVVALAFVFVVASTTVVLARGVDNGTTPEAADDGGLTVLAWNTLGDSPSSQQIADLVLETDADIVSLPETTEETATEVARLLEAAGHPMNVNALSLDDVLKARTTSLLTSQALGSYSRDDSLGTTSVVPTVIAVPDDGEGPVIIAAHPVAPIPGYLDSWRADLRFLATACRGPDVIMAGDLNSTLDHYAGLASTPGAHVGDCTDAAAQTRAASVGTWPTSLPPGLGAPIDHVMATPNWRAETTRVITDRDAAGSDHRPVVARLVPATGR